MTDAGTPGDAAPPAPGVPRGLERLAHDLRGPLAPLQTAAYLLRHGQLDDAKRDELHTLIERQVGRLGTMIEELDDWLRAGQQRLMGTTTRVEPVALLEVAMSGEGCVGGEPADIDDDALLAAVVGDQRRLVQLLRSLLRHARTSAAGNQPRVRVRVADRRWHLDVIAAGGTAGDTTQLLAQPVADHGEDALGLRLLVARSIAEAHGGGLDADAEDGRLRFRCWLPLA